MCESFCVNFGGAREEAHVLHSHLYSAIITSTTVAASSHSTALSSIDSYQRTKRLKGFPLARHLFGNKHAVYFTIAACRRRELPAESFGSSAKYVCNVNDCKWHPTATRSITSGNRFLLYFNKFH